MLSTEELKIVIFAMKELKIEIFSMEKFKIEFKDYDLLHTK